MSLTEAREEEDNMLLHLGYPRKQEQFLSYLVQNEQQIKDIVSHHLNLKSNQCVLSPCSDWIPSSFNVCIPVRVDNWCASRVTIKCPLPYKLGESHYPGNADEKLRCEAATLAWIQDECPDVPVPYLWGAGLPGGQTFTAMKALPLHLWIWEKIRQTIQRLCRISPRQLIPRNYPHTLSCGYLLVDYIEKSQGKSLSLTWSQSRLHQGTRQNLFTSLSRIMLSLSRVAQPRIGSFTLNNTGRISLLNRPLTPTSPVLENEGTPQIIPRHLTYTSTSDYLTDILSYHDARLKHSQNAVRDEYDASAQMAVLAMMRSLYLQPFRRDLRHGPFVFRLTNLQLSDILIDEEGNISSINPDWGTSLPIETTSPPFWISGQSLEQLDGNLHSFNSAREEFMQIFEEQEQIMFAQSTRSRIMSQAWKSGATWAIAMLQDPKVLYNLFFERVIPRYQPSFTTQDELRFQETLSKFWCHDWEGFVKAKVGERQDYLGELGRLFGQA